MLATETPMSGPFFGSTATLTKDINDVMNSGTYQPAEVTAHLSDLQNGIGHINVDNDILRTSRDWSRKFDPVSLAQEKQGNSAF